MRAKKGLTFDHAFIVLITISVVISVVGTWMLLDSPRETGQVTGSAVDEPSDASTTISLTIVEPEEVADAESASES